MTNSPSLINNLITNLASQLTYDLMQAGAGWMRDQIFGDAETRALERVWKSAFSSMLESVSAGLDPNEIDLIGDILYRFINADDVAYTLLNFALSDRPPELPPLRQQFDSLKEFERSRLLFDFDSTMGVLTRCLSEELKVEASNLGSPLYNRLSLSRIEELLTLTRYVAKEITKGRFQSQKYPPLEFPSLPLHFKNRKRELRKLFKDLQPGRIVTLCSTGGMGKTALAVVALHHLTNGGQHPPKDFPDGVIFYSFYNQSSVDLALGQIAVMFGEETLPTPEAAARRVLSGKCAILFLDGAEAADNLDRILDVRGRCAILITSRDRCQIFDQYLDLTPLELDPALSLLRDWGGDQITDEVYAQHICELVGRLPLAIRLAGRYLAAHKENLATYVTWLEKTPLVALDHGKRQLESIPVLLEKSLTQISSEARQALAVASLLAMAPFDLHLIAEGLGVESTQIIPPLNELVRFGLLQRDGDVYQISHTLIRSYSRERLDPPRYALSTLTDALISLVSHANQSGLPLPAMPLLPHLLLVAEANQPKDLVRYVTLCKNLGYYLQMIANYSAARPYYEKSLAIHREMLGEMHPITATSLNNLGGLLQSMGDFDGARPYCTQALAIRKEVLGEKHPDTLNSLNNLGYLLYDMGDFQAARPYFEQALAIRKEVLGEKHPDFASSLNNLGGLLSSMGDYKAARPYYEEALAIRKEVLGEKHPLTALSLENLGSLLLEMSDLRTARSYFEQTLTIRKEVLGEKHLDTACSLNHLGLLFQAMGDYTAARPYFEKALAIRKEVLGDKHPDTACSLNNLGCLIQVMGDLQAARPYFEKTLAICKEVLGEKHPKTATSLNNLGYLLDGLGDYSTAKQCYVEALAINREVLGEKHPDTACSLNNLGGLLESMGDYQAALPYYEQALAINRDVLGEKHTNTALSLNNLGYLLKGMGDLQTARLYYEQALAIFEQISPPNHPYILSIRQNLLTLSKSQKSKGVS